MRGQGPTQLGLDVPGPRWYVQHNDADVLPGPGGEERQANLRRAGRVLRASHADLRVHSVEERVPVIFVHGVPDTTRVWDKVRSRLARRDVIAIELPGFGTPRPAAFQPTKDGYVDWLLSRLAREPKPVDIVGHDWGALLVLRAISLRPELARTWAVGAAPLDPDYEWHKAAKLWQTPEVGERVMEATTPEALAAALTAAGVPADDAAITTKHFDATM